MPRSAPPAPVSKGRAGSGPALAEGPIIGCTEVNDDAVPPLSHRDRILQVPEDHSHGPSRQAIAAAGPPSLTPAGLRGVRHVAIARHAGQRPAWAVRGAPLGLARRVPPASPTCTRRDRRGAHRASMTMVARRGPCARRWPIGTGRDGRPSCTSSSRWMLGASRIAKAGLPSHPGGGVPRQSPRSGRHAATPPLLGHVPASSGCWNGAVMTAVPSGGLTQRPPRAAHRLRHRVQHTQPAVGPPVVTAAG
jgi:hypothetical protein